MLRPLLLAAFLVLGAVGAHAQDATAGVSLAFSKAFEDATIGPGSVTPLTFTISYSSPLGPTATDLAFTDVLPAGVTIATPAVASTTCAGGSRDGAPPTLSAPDGGGTISFSNGGIGPGETCTVTVHVTASTPGTHTNTSGDLTSSLGNSPAATADLTVDTGRPGFSKSFAPSTVAIGGRSTLTFTIDNTLNDAAVASFNFTDEFPSGLVVASPSELETTCGHPLLPPTLTAPEGGSTVSLTASGISTFPALAAGAICTVTVDVEPGGVGAFVNVSESLSASDGSTTRPAGRASAVLTAVVGGDLVLTKSFLDDPVPAGAPVVLRFTLQNLSRTDAATGIAFDDDLDAALSGLMATGGSTPDPACGPGSALTGTSLLSLTGGSLAPGETCTFDVPLVVPAGAAAGTYTNTTTAPTATIGGLGVVGTPASADLFVTVAPTLTKEFTDDPVLAGSAVTLEFTITNNDAAQEVTDLAFSDVMEFLPVPASASSVPADGFCGAGSTMLFNPGFNPTGPGGTSSQITVSGASLPAGGSCTFSLSLDIPLELQPGIYPNTTSEITGTLDGVSVTGAAATDDLEVVAGPMLTKAFSPAIVTPGETTRLSFGLSLSGNSASDATAISFTDDLESVLPGVMVAGGSLPLAACGGTLDGSAGVLTFSGGRLTPGETCEFGVDVVVPDAAPTGVVTNTTSALASTVGGQMLSSPAASADLEVTVIRFEKAFYPGLYTARSPRLIYQLFNDGDTDATISFFTDNMTAVLSGLSVDVDNPTRNSCMSSTSGTTTLLVLGGTIPAGGDCVLVFPLVLPADPPPGTYSSASSPLGTNVGSGAPAVAPLTILDTTPAFSKAFSPATAFATGGVDLVFTIDNTGQSDAATGLAFADDLPDGVIVAPGVPPTTTCTGGTPTAPSQGSTISYSGGSVAADGSCTVTVRVLAFAAGTYDNTTSVLTSSAGESPAATATLTVVDPDVFASKNVSFETDFDGDGLADAGDFLRYTVVIQNLTDGPLASVVFTDTPGANTTLVPGTVTTTIGTVTAGNGSSDTSVAVDVGSLASISPQAEIRFDVEVSATIAESVDAVCNQGTVTASGVRDTFTSDTQFGPSEEPTCLAHDRPEIDAVVTSFEVERGGELRVFATAENTTDTDQTYRLRVNLIDPNGNRKVVRGNGMRLRLGPGETADPLLVPTTYPISPDAPAGTYTVELIATTIEPPTLVDEETFTFELPPSMMVTAFDLSEVRPGAGPNPFLRRTTLRFPVVGGAQVDLRVFDAAGREITVLVDGPLPEGLHEAEFDGSALPAGVYFWRLTVGTERTTGAVTLIR